MNEMANVESCGDFISRGWRSRAATKALLVAGIVAAGLYALGDLFSGLLYEGYSWRDQAISELTAIGAPSRPLEVAVIMVHTLLGIAFAVGVWRAAGRNRALRWAGGILLVAGAVGLFLHPFAPLHGRGVEPTLTDTIHQVVTTVWALIVFAAVAFGAAAYRGRFRLYSIATLVVLPLFGWMAANLDEARAAGLPTPWQGFFERVNAYALMVWLVVLAVTVMRRSLNHVTVEKGAPEVPQTRTQTRAIARGEGLTRNLLDANRGQGDQVASHLVPFSSGMTSGIDLRNGGGLAIAC